MATRLDESSRRRFFVTLCALTTAGFAGCLGDETDDDSSTADGDDGDDSSDDGNDDSDGDDGSSDDEGDDDESGGDDGEDADDGASEDDEETGLPSEAEVEPIVEAWVEAMTEDDMSDLLHPDSSLVPIDRDEEWEFVRIKEIEEGEDDSIVVDTSKQRVSDETYAPTDIILRQHEGEWLVYSTER